MIRVLLVDDHQLIREGLRRSFDRDASFEVVAEAGTLAAGHAALATLALDVVVVDLHLPDGNGMELVRAARRGWAHVGIVVLTMMDGDEHLFDALDAGASAFVNKAAPAEELLAAVRHAVSSPAGFAANNLAEAMQRRFSEQPAKLTSRELDILVLLKEGLSIGEISSRLYVSPSTTKTHIAKVYEKLGASNRTQALMEALRLGLIRQHVGQERSG